MSARKMRDCEGDMWEEQPDESWAFTEPDGTTSYFPTLNTLEHVWGPLSEVGTDG